MTPEVFIKQYEAALASQEWQNVEPLMHPEVCVTFSNGGRHRGLQAVEEAFTHNFNMIKDETYKMTELHFASKIEGSAVFLFKYEWSGYINGEFMSGHGLGTSSIVKEGAKWKLVAEHLGPGG